MKKQLQLVISALVLAGGVSAQEKQIKKEEVIIRKDGSVKEEKMTVVVNGDSVFVNGKPVKEEDGNFIIRKKMIGADDDAPATPQAFLGVNIETADNGVRVVSVSEGSNAEKAGLKEGDIIVSLAGKTEKDPEAFRNLVRAQKPNEEVEIVYIPAGEKKEKKMKVKLGSTVSMSKIFTYTMPGSSFNQENFDMKMFKNLPDDLGLMIERELGRYSNSNKPQLGVKIQDTDNGAGVKVLEVTEGSLADKSGVKENDLLMAIDGIEVKDTDEAREALQKAREKSAYKLKLNRGGKIIELEITIPKKLKEAIL